MEENVEEAYFKIRQNKSFDFINDVQRKLKKRQDRDENMNESNADQWMRQKLHKQDYDEDNDDNDNPDPFHDMETIDDTIFYECEVVVPMKIIADAPICCSWQLTKYIKDTWINIWQYQHHDYAES